MNRLFLLLLLLLGCSLPKNQNRSNDAVIPTPDLSDKLFKFKNIQSTLLTRSPEFREIHFVELDSFQRARLTDQINPLKSIKPYYSAEFISKQDKISGIQPIIINVRADDYHALIMFNLDQKNSYFWFIEFLFSHHLPFAGFIG